MNSEEKIQDLRRKIGGRGVFDLRDYVKKKKL